jgi:hypothetical protein
VVVHQWDCGRWGRIVARGRGFSGQFAKAAADGAEQAELARARDGDDVAFTLYRSKMSRLV